MDPTTTATPGVTKAPNRRHVLYGGVAAAAVVAGASFAWWRHTPTETPSAVLDTLWNNTFDTPQGAPLPMMAFRGKPLLVNFWATWCPPCVEELPLIDTFYRQHAAKSWQVLGLAIDQPSAVRTFLARTPVSFPVGLAGLVGTELGKSLGNSSGGLPFSVVVSAGGSILHRKMGRLAAADLTEWARAA